MNNVHLTTPLSPTFVVPHVVAPWVAQLAEEAHLSLNVVKILAHRTGDIDIARRWLMLHQGSLDEVLSDPMDLSDMAPAIQRIHQAIETKEPIVVYGDYDVDGITATILMVQALEAWGANVTPFFPDRQTEGYGLSQVALERCFAIRQKQQRPKPSLMITVDCGVTSVEEVQWLRQHHQIDVIVTDHHTPLEILPQAIAVVNPHLQAGRYGEEASGCATAFAIVRALATSFEQKGRPATNPKCRPEHYLDLVCLSTISDVMPLNGDNRILVARGLRTMADPVTGNQGIKALLKRQNLSEPTAERLAFTLCPCINAAGRLGTTELHIRGTTARYNLLHEAYRLFKLEDLCAAPLLDEANKKRREIERLLHDKIKERVDLKVGEPIAIGGEIELFHPGVIGIVASRILEHTHAPVAIITQSDNGGHGSMRSPQGYHAIEILKHLEAMLDHYGGHAEAAGFSLKPGMYDAFVAAFPEACAAQHTHLDESSAIYADMDLSMEPITLAFCEDLTRLEPYGHGNPRPLFMKTFEIKSFRTIGSDGKHLSLKLLPDDGQNELKAIWFGGAQHLHTLDEGIIIRALFTLDVDTYRDPCPCVRIVQVLN